MEKHYMDKHFFVYENYEKLVDAIGKETKNPDAEIAKDAREDLTFLRQNVIHCVDYVHTVDSAETTIKTARFRHEDEEFREIVSNVDRNRRIVHEAAIASAAILNRLARIYGVDKIFVGNDEDRYQVADFCLELTVGIFEHRQL